jgi:RimJ/RimL family protein N-acetyltransferase
LRELRPHQYANVRALFEPLWYHLVIFSAIEGHTPARIVADDPEHPTVAFVWDKVEGDYYLAGDPDNHTFNRALNRFILDEIYPEAQADERASSDLALNYAPMAWERVLDEVLAGINVMRHTRKHFLFQELRVPDWRDRVPQGFEMVEVDADFLKRTGLKQMDERVLRWIRHAWGGVEGFLARGFGCCLVHENTIVSTCTGDYAVGHTCEMGVGTDEDYRRRGFATLTVSATLEQCLARGFTEIGWHCWSANRASAATARKAGFRQTLEHPVYHAWYNTIDNWLVQAKLYCDGPVGNTVQPVDYPAAAAAYRQALALVESDPATAERARIWGDVSSRPYIYHDAARAHLHIGDLQAARGYLDEAIEAGLPGEHLQRSLQDETLAHLHHTAAWQDLVDHLENRT